MTLWYLTRKKGQSNSQTSRIWSSQAQSSMRFSTRGLLISKAESKNRIISLGNFDKKSTTNPHPSTATSPPQINLWNQSPHSVRTHNLLSLQKSAGVTIKIDQPTAAVVKSRICLFTKPAKIASSIRRSKNFKIGSMSHWLMQVLVFRS